MICVYYLTQQCSCRKARRKEREGAENSTSGDSKLYLEAPVLERKLLSELDMRMLVDLPAGLDYNEWLASHSKNYRYLRRIYR